MQNKGKTNSVVTHALVAGGVIEFTVKGAGSFRLDPNALSQAVRDRAMLHGLIQRVSDKAALGRDPVTGLPASPQDKLDRMRALAEFYMEGGDAWSPDREASGEGGGKASLTMQGIAAYFKTSVADAERRVLGLAERKGVDRKVMVAALAKEPAIIQAIADIKAARAPAGGAGLLAEMAGEGEDEDDVPEDEALL